MEEEIEVSSKPSIVSVALAIFGIVLGGTGVYFGIYTNQKLVELRKSVDRVSDLASDAGRQIATLENFQSKRNSQNKQLETALARSKRESLQAVQIAQQVNSGVTANRQELIRLAKAIQQLADSGHRPNPIPSTVSGSNHTARLYKVQPGDTFSKIAGQNGVDLNALMDANPDVDPKRLSIGQEIRMPPTN